MVILQLIILVYRAENHPLLLAQLARSPRVKHVNFHVSIQPVETAVGNGRGQAVGTGGHTRVAFCGPEMVIRPWKNQTKR